jgi:hypothetical protein
MPIKKTTTEGPKAKLMKQTIPALRKKAKALGVSDYTKRTKENLVQSIMLAEARKKRGTGMAGRKAKLKPVPQKKVGEYVYGKDGRRVKSVTSMPTGILNTPEHRERSERIRNFKNSHTPTKADKGRFAMRPGKRISKNGNVYYEYRGNRADASVDMHGDIPSGEAWKIIPTIEKALEVYFVNYWETIHGKIAQFQSVEEFVVPHYELNEAHRFTKEELSKLLKISSFRWVEAKRTVEYTVDSEFDDKLYATKWTYTVGF